MRETFHRMADGMENLSRRVRRRGNEVLADQYMNYAMNVNCTCSVMFSGGTSLC